MGLSSLDVDIAAEEAFKPGRGTASSEYEAAKRAAGIPTDSQPNTLSMGRAKGLGGFLGGPIYAARFRLDALSGELLDPLTDLLGKRDYFFGGDHPSSLDCLAFGYLSLLFYPALPQAWLRETIQTKYPRIVTYLDRLREQLFHNEETSPHDVWSISTGRARVGEDRLLPWRPRDGTFISGAMAGTREFVSNVPVISWFLRRHTISNSSQLEVSTDVKSELPSRLFVNTLLSVAATFAVGLTSLAIHHRRSPRDGALIFWSLRPTTGFGEAGNILSVLAHQLPGGAPYSQF
jgi:hypothetical protein